MPIMLRRLALVSATLLCDGFGNDLCTDANGSVLVGDSNEQGRQGSDFQGLLRASKCPGFTRQGTKKVSIQVQANPWQSNVATYACLTVAAAQSEADQQSALALQQVV